MLSTSLRSLQSRRCLVPVLLVAALQSMRAMTTSAVGSAGGIRTTAAASDVFVAMGSNLGDRFQHFQTALAKLSGAVGQVCATSFLYETSPMYHTDQPRFLNAACHLKTTLSPSELLRVLKTIESEVGRTETFRNGPRVLDLDILLYGSITMNAPDLVLPHPRISEREFVLRPLCDIAATFEHPVSKKNVQDMLNQLSNANTASSENIYRVLPLGRRVDPAVSLPVRNLVRIGDRVLIAGILNVTPDSFSDGGKFFSVSAAVDQARAMISDGADIIDVGGESTRPGSQVVDVEEELRRVIPVIDALRKDNMSTCISIDTRNAIVAEAAIAAGADMINDVSGGRHDPRMIAVASKHAVPIILMHMRGTPQTMTAPKLTHYNEAVSTEAAAELQQIFDSIDQGSLPKWLQIVDPGIGFAKNIEHNLELLHPSNLQHFQSQLGGRPMMVGPSRKRFINTILAKEGSSSAVTLDDRDWGTAGACCAAVAGGADILRVHNVRGIRAACDVMKRIAIQK